MRTFKQISDDYQAGKITKEAALEEVIKDHKDDGALVYVHVLLNDMFQINDPLLILGVIDAIISDNPKLVETVKKNPKAANQIVGQVMKYTNGRADPGITDQVIKEKFNGL